MHRTAALTAVALILLAWAPPALAREDEQLWTGAQATVKLDKKWLVSQEAVARFSRTRGGLYEIEAATMLGFRPAKDVIVAAGYVHNPLFVDGDLVLTERRAREQITFDNVAQIGSGRLSARLRFEQRWRKGVDETGHRVRPFVRFQLPFLGKTRLGFSNELFVNLNRTPFQGQRGIDRMRNAVVLNIPMSSAVSIESGYLNQHAFVRGGEDVSDHAATLSLSLSL